MELLIAITLILGVLAIVYLGKKSSRSRPSSTLDRRPESGSVKTKRHPEVYRPSPSPRTVSRQGIHFPDNDSRTNPLTDQDVKDLVDALTGVPLQPALGLFQCRRCKVFYQTHSFEVIQSENGGRCVSCLHAEIESIAGRREQRGRNADVSVVTLENYRQYVGHVITFEGEVHKVLTSQRGTDHAIMFENRTWTRGFKLVVFRGDVDRIGGARFLFSTVGHRVRVRGLLIEHKTFGYEIIVSDPAMILSVL